MQPDAPTNELQMRSQGKTQVIDVPWDSAEALHAYLKQQGIETILCTNPREREAYLEVHPGTNPEDVRRALEQWES